MLPTKSDTFLEILHKLWAKYKRYLAYVLLAVIAAPRFFPGSSGVQKGATWALGIILMNEFYKLIDIGNKGKARRSFANIAEAQEEIYQYIKECNHRDGNVEIRWIGMTMCNVWGILNFTLNKLQEEGMVRKLRLRVVMLDPQYLASNRINPAWTPIRSQSTSENIVAYFEAAQAKGLDWKQEITFYAEMPGIHGGVINGKYLLSGMCRWRTDGLHGGDYSYSLYTFKEQNDLEQMEIFSGWFEHHAKPQSISIKLKPVSSAEGNSLTSVDGLIGM